MINPELYDQINGLAATLFLVLLCAGFARTMARVREYRRAKKDRPAILTRDAIDKTGLVMSFGAIIIVRALNLGPYVTDNVLWALVTDIGGIMSVAVYAYYEWFVIERGAK